MPHSLRLQPLATPTFAPYGDVLELAGGDVRSINAGTSARRELPSALQFTAAGGAPALATFRVQPQRLAGPWRMLERHRFGSQTFVPLQAGRWVVLVARGDAAPDRSTLAAFEASSLQGVTLHPGTWHHPLIALDGGLFLVLERAGAEVDCEVVQLAEPIGLSA